MNRLAVTMALLISASTLGGCATLEVPYHAPNHVGGWDPVFGDCHGFGTCGGDGCTADGCGNHFEGHTPASYLRHQLTCGAGCGEIYWGPWFSDPPDACDPCDDHGNWVGPRCCKPKLRQRLWAGLTGQWSCNTGCGKGGKGHFAEDVEWSEMMHEPGTFPGPLNEAPTPEQIPTPAQPGTSRLRAPATPSRTSASGGGVRLPHAVTGALPFQLHSTRFDQAQSP